MTYTRIIIGILSFLYQEHPFKQVNFLEITNGARMLSWTLLFLVIAIIAGILGFWVIAGLAAWIAKVLFIIFLIFFVLGLISGRKPPV